MTSGRDYSVELRAMSMSFQHVSGMSYEGGSEPSGESGIAHSIAGLSFPTVFIAEPGDNEIARELTEMATDEEATTEDPVRMYLREIGRVNLLTAEDEKRLARKIEDGKRLLSVQRAIGCPENLVPRAVDLFLGLYREILAASALSSALWEITGEPEPDSARERLYGEPIRKLLASSAPPLLEWLASRLDCATEIAEKAFLHYSVDTHLLAPEVEVWLGDGGPFEGVASLPSELEMLPVIAQHAYEVARRFEMIRIEADRSERRLTEANLRLVVSVAKRYLGRGMSMLDLIQEGNLGLLRAVDKFDYRRGYKFSTYATWWIRQAITRAIADQSRTIRIPVHMVETINRLIRASRRLTQDLGREPSPDEIAQEMNDLDGTTIYTGERVREIIKAAQEPVSLEMPVGEEDDSHLGDFIQDSQAVAPSEAAAGQILREQVESALRSLPPRERKVLRLRFGIDDGRTRTLEEVGREFGVTRERIRQIEAKALRKLRHPSRSKRLKGYLE